MTDHLELIDALGFNEESLKQFVEFADTFGILQEFFLFLLNFDELSEKERSAGIISIAIASFLADSARKRIG